MRKKIGVDCFRQGYNCAQSVLCAFASDLHIDKKDLLAIGSSLGGGFARSRNLCGAVNAMGIIYGLVTGEQDKAKAYQAVDLMIKDFTSIYGNINCGQILKNVVVTEGIIPEKRTKEYYATRPCEKVVEDCVLIIEKYLFNIKPQ